MRISHLSLTLLLLVSQCMAVRPNHASYDLERGVASASPPLHSRTATLKNGAKAVGCAVGTGVAVLACTAAGGAAFAIGSHDAMQLVDFAPGTSMGAFSAGTLALLGSAKASQVLFDKGTAHVTRYYNLARQSSGRRE